MTGASDVPQAPTPPHPATEHIYQYQFQLIARRWQTFLGYLVSTGILLNGYAALAEQASDTDANTTSGRTMLLLCLVGIFLSAICSRYVGLLSVRLREKQDQLIALGAELVVSMPSKPALLLESSTTLTLGAILTLSIPWFFLLSDALRDAQLSPLWTVAVVAMSFANALTIQWKH